MLANSDIDQDLTKLTYSGLMRSAGTDANTEIIPDLAESYTVSPDGKVYTFILKKMQYSMIEHQLPQMI